jgi:ribosomal protein L37E
MYNFKNVFFIIFEILILTKTNMTKQCTNCETENHIDSKYCSICGYTLPIVEEKSNISEVPTKDKKKSNKKFDMKTMVGFMVGFIVMFFVSQQLFKPSLNKQLVEIANEINKTCPTRIDQYTTLKNVVALPNKTIQYNYILEGITKEQVDLNTLKSSVFPVILENAKSNPEMKFFRDNTATLNYHYSDKNGVFVTEYIITPEMYL